MSSTNHTTNYGLSQFLGTDKPAWLVDYNGDMAAIDTQMKANADAASGAQTTANTADGKADTNASAIITLDTQINGASGIASDVTALQGSFNTITSLIGNGEPTTTNKTLIGAINEIDARFTGKAFLGNISIEVGTVTADGVKTFAALLSEANAALCAAAQALPAYKFYKVCQLYCEDLGYSYTSDNELVIGHSTGSYIAGEFSHNGITGAGADVMTVASVELAADGNSYARSFSVDGSANLTVNDDASTVITTGTKIGFVVDEVIYPA